MTAWIGLLGVLVGAVITVGFEVWRDKKRERAALSAAVARVASELKRNERWAMLSIESGWYVTDVRPSMRVWAEESSTLAASLGIDEWEEIDNALGLVEHLEVTVSLAAALEEKFGRIESLSGESAGDEELVIDDTGRHNLARFAEGCANARAMLLRRHPSGP